jgi:exopolyphosphatase/guanosine-5'-triphosphate,3'-diphosphate pyrophosphatase
MTATPYLAVDEAIEGGETLAAVDLGSNSFHLIVARYVHGELQVIDRMREMVQLAAGLDDSGFLQADARDRALECLERFGQRLAGLPIPRVRALATNTFRKLANPRPFLREAEAALGHPIEIVSEHEEARLIYIGVAHGLATSTGRRLVIDIGGGSTEFVVGAGYVPLELESVSCGCVGISQVFFPDNRVTRPRFREAERSVALGLRPIRNRLRMAGWTDVVGSSGTIRAAEQLSVDLGFATSGITLSGLKGLRRLMQELDSSLDLTQYGISDRRARVLPGGLAILTACFKNFEIGTMQVSELAMREGALRDLVGRVEHDDPREASVTALAARYQVDDGQAHRVQRTALAAFDQLKESWGLSASERLLLDWGARLHEIGLAISHLQYQAHSAYLAEHTPLSGFSREEQLALACLILGHRGKVDPAIFAALPDRWVVGTMRTCVILRLAVLLHRSRIPDALPALEWKVQGEKLLIKFPGKWLAGHPLTRADLAEEKAQLGRLDVSLRY